MGAGQLGQMLGIAASRLGVSVTFLDPATDPPAASTGAVICRPFDSEEGLARLAAVSDVVTFEFENVPVAAALAVAEQVPVFPPPSALRYAQDRWLEKQLFDSLRIPVPRYARVDSEADLAKAADGLQFPFVVKSRTMGYDGKGQFVVREAAGLDSAWRALGPAPLIAEQWIDFDYEVSLIGARRASGAITSYDLTENCHRDGILKISRAPSRNTAMRDAARAYTVSLLERLDYVGVLALEMFVVGEKLLANEFAPRVHNSGHWTIEGAMTSQFENHLRAVFDMPFGDPSTRGFAGMLNLIGNMPDRLSLPRHFPWFLHDYGKPPRPGRKLGHLTVLADDRPTLDRRLAELAEFLAE
jgi:5-(carboxyamino)imidazole ribonucleotide synthase